MVEITLYDYEDESGWFWHVIGTGRNTTSDVKKQLDAAAGADILVRINSCGGSVYEGWGIHSLFTDYPGKVNMKIEGVAASIASIIAMSGDTVEMAAGSLLMVHKPSLFLFGDYTDEQMDRESEALKKVQKVLVSLYEAKCNLSADEINEMCNKETWLTPSEAVAMGFADMITEKKKAVALPSNLMHRMFNGAPANIRQYANSMAPHKSINPNTMNNETTEAIKENSSLLRKFLNMFKNSTEDPDNTSSELKDGTKLYYSGSLSVDTAVFTDEAMTEAAADGDYTLADERVVTVVEGKVTAIADAPTNEGENKADNSAEMEQLKNEISEMKLENKKLLEQLNNSNKQLKEITSSGSAYKPAARTQDFGKGKKAPTDEDRKNEMEEKRKNLTKKK